MQPGAGVTQLHRVTGMTQARRLLSGRGVTVTVTGRHRFAAEHTVPLGDRLTSLETGEVTGMRRTVKSHGPAGVKIRTVF